MGWLYVGQAYIIIFFMVSSLSKLLSFNYFLQQIRQLNLFRSDDINWSAGILIIIAEFVSSILLSLQILPALVLTSLILMIGIFTIVIFNVYRKAEGPVSCACFGRYFDSELGKSKIISNLVLLGILVTLLLIRLPSAPQLLHYSIGLILLVLYFGAHHVVATFNAYRRVLKQNLDN